MREALEYFFFILLRSIARRISFRLAGTIGALLGEAVFVLTDFRKSVTLDNLRQAFPEKNVTEIQAIAREAYRNYGIALVESLWAAGQSAEELKRVVRVENPEIMTNALAKQRGAILLSAHYGSWELLVTSVRLNLGAPFANVVQRQRNKRIDAEFDASRSRFGNFTIALGSTSRKVLSALAENYIVLMLGDQSGPKEAVFVNFFKRPAATHRGAAAFSLKTGAPIVMGFLVRQADGTYVMTLEEVDTSGLNSADHEENIIVVTQRHVQILERWIRKHPDHWLWMHKRWKHEQYYLQQQLSEREA